MTINNQQNQVATKCEQMSVKFVGYKLRNGLRHITTLGVLGEGMSGIICIIY